MAIFTVDEPGKSGMAFSFADSRFDESPWARVPWKLAYGADPSWAQCFLETWHDDIKWGPVFGGAGGGIVEGPNGVGLGALGGLVGGFVIGPFHAVASCHGR